MTTYKHSIMVIEDHEATRETLSEMLQDMGHKVCLAENKAKALVLIQKNPVDLFLSDLMLPDGTGIEILQEAMAAQPRVPFVIITGHGSIKNAIEATRLGAYEYIQKPLDINKLRVVVKNALHLRDLERRVGESDPFKELIGQSTAIIKLKEMITQVAKTNATVLIQGESGTGKELVARAFQTLSNRRNQPFVIINIAALPRELLESELFGHEKGAFTGAIQQRKGRFELANNGTLFLDEISEMPLETQVKLLRVLQDQRFERVGGMEMLETDFRLITATNADLKAAIAEGKFREDLYFRINVVSVPIPPLRERIKDIPLLAGHFLQRYNNKYNAERQISREAQAVLAAYHWPGNVRELENAIERAVVICIKKTIEPEDLPPEVRGTAQPVAGSGKTGKLTKSDTASAFPTELALDEIEKRYILSELERLAGNKTQLAKSLGIGLKTLYRKLEAWGKGADKD